MNRRIRAQRPTPTTEGKRAVRPASNAPAALDAMRAPDLLAMQATAGNRAARTALQRSMEVGAAGDASEVEADAVAREIVSGGAPAAQRESVEEDELQMSRVQRATPEEEELQLSRLQRAMPEEEELQAKHLQRESVEEGELQMSRFQRDAAPEVGMEGGSVSGETSTMVESARGGGQPLAADVRREMEGHFDADFSGVRVHEGAEAADLNSRLSARAFTTGSDIFIGEGGLNAGSRGGKELLAHELTHVVQQGAAGRKPKRTR